MPSFSQKIIVHSHYKSWFKTGKLTDLLMIGYFQGVWPRSTLAFCPLFQSLSEIFSSGILCLKKDRKDSFASSFATHLWTAHSEEVYNMMYNTFRRTRLWRSTFPFPLWREVSFQDILQFSFTDQWWLWKIVQIHVFVELKQNPLFHLAVNHFKIHCVLQKVGH